MCWQEDQESWPPSTPVQTRWWELDHISAQTAHREHYNTTELSNALLFRSTCTREALVTCSVAFSLKMFTRQNSVLIFDTESHQVWVPPTPGRSRAWRMRAALRIEVCEVKSCALTVPLSLSLSYKRQLARQQWQQIPLRHLRVWLVGQCQEQVTYQHCQW